MLLPVWLQNIAVLNTWKILNLVLAWSWRGGDNTACLSSCRENWVCLVLRLCFHFADVSGIEPIFSPNSMHNVGNWIQNWDCCSCVWRAGMSGSQEFSHFFLVLSSVGGDLLSFFCEMISLCNRQLLFLLKRWLQVQSAYGLPNGVSVCSHTGFCSTQWNCFVDAR